MANGKRGSNSNKKQAYILRDVPRKKARSVAIAEAGVSTGAEFASLMSALIADIAADRIDPRTANSICNAGGKLLKIVELQHKYAGPAAKRASQRPDLLLADPPR